MRAAMKPGLIAFCHNVRTPPGISVILDRLCRGQPLWAQVVKLLVKLINSLASSWSLYPTTPGFHLTGTSLSGSLHLLCD